MNCANKLQRQNYSKISYRDILDWKTVNRYTVTHKCQYISRLDYVLRMLWVECNNVMQWGFITLILPLNLHGITLKDCRLWPKKKKIFSV